MYVLRHQELAVTCSSSVCPVPARAAHRLHFETPIASWNAGAVTVANQADAAAASKLRTKLELKPQVTKLLFACSHQTGDTACVLTVTHRSGPPAPLTAVPAVHSLNSLTKKTQKIFIKAICSVFQFYTRFRHSSQALRVFCRCLGCSHFSSRSQQCNQLIFDRVRVMRMMM